MRGCVAILVAQALPAPMIRGGTPEGDGAHEQVVVRRAARDGRPGVDATHARWSPAHPRTRGSGGVRVRCERYSIDGHLIR